MRKVIQCNQQTACLSAVSAPGQLNSRAKAIGPKVIAVLKLWLGRWIERRRLRTQLHKMNTELLERDIGVPPGSFFEEAHKPFWRQ